MFNVICTKCKLEMDDKSIQFESTDGYKYYTECIHCGNRTIYATDKWLNTKEQDLKFTNKVKKFTHEDQ